MLFNDRFLIIHNVNCTFKYNKEQGIFDYFNKNVSFSVHILTILQVICSKLIWAYQNITNIFLPNHFTSWIFTCEKFGSDVFLRSVKKIDKIVSITVSNEKVSYFCYILCNAYVPCDRCIANKTKKLLVF